MDYQPQVVVKKDAHGHKKPVQEFVFNSYQNSIDNAAQVPRVVRCAELPVCAVLRRVLGSCARAGCARRANTELYPKTVIDFCRLCAGLCPGHHQPAPVNVCQ
jgi:hypothetical protein